MLADNKGDLCSPACSNGVADIKLPALLVEKEALGNLTMVAQAVPSSVHDPSIPVIDLSGLFEHPTSLEIRKAVVAQIGQAAEECGFFQVVHHGLSLPLLEQVFAVSKEFFQLPLQEKLKSRSSPAAPVAIGYVNDDYTRGVLDPKEHILIFHEEDTLLHYSPYNIWPHNPQQFRPIVEKFLEEMEKTAVFLMGLVSESLGLPTNFIHDLCKEKMNALSMFCYPPSQEPAYGSSMHKDANVLTLLAQNNASGLQVVKDNEWVTVEPIDGALIINIGDMLQVWSNGKYKSVTHRVMNNKAATRYSLVYFYTPGLKTCITPLPQFTTQIGEPAKYRGFIYEEYLKLRFENKKNMDKDTPEVGLSIYETVEAKSCP